MSIHLTYVLYINLVCMGAVTSHPAPSVANDPIPVSATILSPKGINSLSLGEWSRHKELILAKRDSLSYAILDRAKCKSDKAQQDLAVLQARFDKLEKVIAQIGILENSDVEYVLKGTSNDVGSTSWDVHKKCIILSVGSTANFIHELMHGWQYETGEIMFDARFNKCYLQDLEDEVEAYRAQYAFDPGSVTNLPAASTLRSMRGITPVWVSGLTNKDGEKTYAEHGRVRVNVNSSKAMLMLAYPQLQQQFITWQETWTMKNVPDMIYKQHPVADFD
ncbi:hypothetical protein [Paraflavitalea pollutisoli]|uniref:hypothetical protein n=1 Tax=Paraflavitalea pollutisoli TaxID=3034143 RepID=UPI0023EC191E|nr:hypothetical protein [Paraflavitalea sp. H1-2-19X]